MKTQTTLYGIPKAQLLAIVKEIKSKNKADKDRQRMIDNDAYFEKYWEQDRIEKCGIAPIVRLHVYGDEPIRSSQIISGYYGFGKRGPVVMRGSRFCMERKYSTKSAMADEIKERYFRLIGYTSNDRSKHMDVLKELAKKLSEKGYYVHRDFCYSRLPGDGLWFKGEWIFKDDEKYLEIMEQVDARKARKIKREVAYQESKQRWSEAQKKKAFIREQRTNESRDKHQQALALKRRQKAEQIAAYELLQEMKHEHA